MSRDYFALMSRDKDELARVGIECRAKKVAAAARAALSNRETQASIVPAKETSSMSMIWMETQLSNPSWMLSVCFCHCHTGSL